MKISFIGSGRMAEALIKGLLRAKILRANNIFASDVSLDRLKYLNRVYKINVLSSNPAAATADVIILSVKPHIIPEVLSQIKAIVKREQLIISIAAGVTLKALERALPGIPIVRVMPNNPAIVGEGISAIVKGKHVSSKNIKIVEEIFGAVGKTVRVPERLMNAVTALSSSGPAFVYLMIEALIEGGIKGGLQKATSEKLTTQTVLGSIKTVIETGRSPRELREMVTSPSGTTLAGLNILEKRKFREALVEAIAAAKKRAFELSKA